MSRILTRSQKVGMERNIFTIERRQDFNKAFADFFEDVVNTHVVSSTGQSFKMILLLEHGIRFWPYRCSATSIDSYLKQIDVDMTNPKSDTDFLLIMELLINLLHWAPRQDMQDDKDSEFSITFKKNDIQNESDRLLGNAVYILEQCCNMRVREEDGNCDFPKYFISKRDSEVDAVLEDVPDLAETLLGYLDVRNQGDRDYKKNSIATIYQYMEPHRKEYKGLSCSSISEEFFSAVNAFGIRHNTKSQVSLHYTKRIPLYDKLYKMAIYVLMTDKVCKYKEEVKKMRTSPAE